MSNGGFSYGAGPMGMGMSVGNSGGMGMGMSISPHYANGFGGAGAGSYTNFGSYMHQGSVGGPGWGGAGMRGRQESFGAAGDRSRELEAKFVRDFTCCGLRLGGLHDLLEQ